MMLTAGQITEYMLQERLSLTAYIYTTTRNYHMAEDIYQEICVKAINYTTGFDTRIHLINWFRLCARNRAIDVLRSRNENLLCLTDKAYAALEQHWDDEANSVKAEELSALSTCMEKLTPRNRELIRLRYFEGKTGEQIANTMGQKIKSTYQGIMRIHKILADCVRQQMGKA